MRKCLEITFEGTEFNLVAVETAQEALEKVQSLGPALVIADASLPPSDGYELVGAIKSAAPDVPVLVLSSKHNPFDAQKGSQADGHVDKPFDTQMLQDKAREMAQPGDKKVTTDVPGAPKPAPAPAERTAAASSKIPAPRRKRPTPAVSTASGAQGQTPKPSPAAAAQGRTVPFAMPGSAKRASASQEAPKKAQPAAAKPAPGSPTAPGATPAAAQTGAVAGGAVSLPAEAAADLETKLGALGLSKEQMEGVLALSREVVEQVVWDVVPTLAEVLIKEEIKRLTSDG